jgi:hypothetical protein
MVEGVYGRRRVVTIMYVPLYNIPLVVQLLELILIRTCSLVPDRHTGSSDRDARSH